MPKKDRTLAILDVGHGNCAVLSDSRGVVVIDSGPGNALLEYLREKKIRTVAVLLLSHADKDHIGGVAGLLSAKTVRISRVCLNCDSSKGSKIWDDLVYELDQADNRKELVFTPTLVHDESGTYDQGEVRVQVLAPSKYLAGKGAGGTDRAGRTITTNSLSAVIRLVQHGKSIAVFPGDLDEIALDDMISHRVDAKAPILVFPHHGGKSGSGSLERFVEKLCKAVQPLAVVFSIARGRAKHPLPEVLALLRKYAKVCRIACTQLSEHCATSTPSADPKHLLDVFARGRETRQCCAGTLVVDLNRAESLFPADPDHQAFIAAHAATALCRGG